MRSAFESLCVMGAVCTWSISSVADEPRSAQPVRRSNTDTSYGRIEGDAMAVVGVGATLGPRAPRATVDLRLRYLETAGLFFDYEDGALLGGGSDPRRVFATGLELRPLFMGRWLTGRESASTRADLLVDSIGLELGAAFLQPDGGSFSSRPALQAGLGVEAPILASARGPWIGFHGGARWSDKALRGDAIGAPSDRALFLSITLAWHEPFLSHAIDAGDRAPR